MIFLSYVGICFCFIDLFVNMDLAHILHTVGRGQIRRAVYQTYVTAAEWRNVRAILLCIGCYMVKYKAIATDILYGLYSLDVALDLLLDFFY